MNNFRAPPRSQRRSLRAHLQNGDLDLIDGLFDEFEDALDNLPIDEFIIPRAMPAVIPPNFAARIGLNDTPLTRAIAAGDFEAAEQLIMENSDPEYLNDGAHSATPLALALTGRSAYNGLPRNLKIAKLLVERGANVNLRIPHHDLETASESPLELLTKFYISLLKYFQNPNRSPEKTLWKRSHREYVEMDLLDTVGINGEEKLSPLELTEQTRELFLIFLENGANINLQTNESGRTVFHLLMACEVQDRDLIKRMVLLGALVNLTDVHGTTPLMDIIKHKEKDRTPDTFQLMAELGKRLLLDAQNCSGESALFRAMFHGNASAASLFLEEGAASFTMARVQDFRKRSNNCFCHFYRRPSISNLPCLLAPLLGDSACLRSAKKKLSKNSTEQKHCSRSFSVNVLNEVIYSKISPFVDLGWFCTREVEKTIHELIKVHTSFAHLTETKVFQEIAIIPILFGNLSGGLQQLCIRKILMTSLFNKSGKHSRKLPHFGISGVNGKQSLPQSKKNQGSTPMGDVIQEFNVNQDQNSERVVESNQHRQDREFASLSEPEYITFEETEARSARKRSLSARQLQTIDENWSFQRDPHYPVVSFSRGASALSSSSSHKIEETLLELEISKNVDDTVTVTEFQNYENSSFEDDVSTLNNLRKTLSDVSGTLKETKAQIEVADTIVATEKLEKGVDSVTSTIEKLSDEVNALKLREADCLAECLPEARIEVSAKPSAGCSNTQSDNADCQSQGNAITNSESSDSSSSENDTDDPESEDDLSSSGEEAFSFGNVFYGSTFSNSQSLHNNQSNRSCISHESLVRSFTPEKLAILCGELGLPPGIRPLVELEVARLQLGLGVFRHKSIKCDRGCEGEDDTASSSDESEWNPDSLITLSESDFDNSSLITLSESDFDSSSFDDSSNDDSSLDDVKSHFTSDGSSQTGNTLSSTRSSSSSFGCSVPRRPRILSSTSSSDGNDEHVGGSVAQSQSGLAISSRALHAESQENEDCFTFSDGEAEERRTHRYVKENLADPEGFARSTESSATSSSEDEQ